MRITPRVLFFAFGFSVAGLVQAQETGSLLVISKHDQTLAIVDPATLQVVARVPVGEDPHEVAANADGTVALVSNYGSGAYHTLAVVDLVAHKALPAIDLGPLRGPHGLVFVGGKFWFTVEGSKAVARYDPATRQVDWVMGTGQNRTHMLYVSSDGLHLVTTNVNSSTVSIIDFEPVRQAGTGRGGARPAAARPTDAPPPQRPANAAPAPRGNGPPSSTLPMPTVDWNETVIQVGSGSEGFDVSPDGKEIWVGNANAATVSIIGRQEKKVIATLDVNVPRANRLRFTPDGKLVLVSSSADLVILDASTRTVVKRLQLGQFGHGAGGVFVQPDGARAFVGLGPDNFVAVVDLHTFEVVGHIDVGGEPDGMAWAVRHADTAAQPSAPPATSP